VSLKVWNFAIPSTATLRSAFGMNWNGPCLGHGDASCGNSAAETALRVRYVIAALDNRFSIDAPEMGSPVLEDGTTRWADFDAAVGPLLDGTAPTRLPGARLTSLRAQTATSGLTSAAAQAWGQHFRDRGWFPALFNLLCDEPPLTCAFSDITGRAATSHEGDPGIPTVVTTTAALAQENGVTGIDLFAPVMNGMEDKPGFGATHEGSQRETYGATVWWYQSCMSHGCARPTDDYGRSYFSGWPTLQVDADGSRYRAQEWLSYLYGVSGMLYFETVGAYTQGDPWQYQEDFGAWGDGNLFYPGTPAKIGGQTEIPIESLRMKGIRDGEEDYELLVLARAAGHGPEAWEIAHSVFARTYQGNATAQALEDARQELAALIGG
jgi:glycosyl hydrolase family 123